MQFDNCSRYGGDLLDSVDRSKWRASDAHREQTLTLGILTLFSLNTDCLCRPECAKEMNKPGYQPLSNSEEDGLIQKPQVITFQVLEFS